MTYEEDCKELDLEIKPDRRYAQILIKITDSSKSEKEAEQIIENLGAHIISKNCVSMDLTLFKLDVRDMREIALRLTENGFKIKGINAFE